MADEKASASRDAIDKALHEHIRVEVLLRDEARGANDDLFDGGFDSMSLTRKLVFVEERFGTVIQDEDVMLDEFETLKKLTDFVHGYLGRLS